MEGQHYRATYHKASRQQSQNSNPGVSPPQVRILHLCFVFLSQMEHHLCAFFPPFGAAFEVPYSFFSLGCILGFGGGEKRGNRLFTSEGSSGCRDVGCVPLGVALNGQIPRKHSCLVPRSMLMDEPCSHSGVKPESLLPAWPGLAAGFLCTISFVSSC